MRTIKRLSATLMLALVLLMMAAPAFGATQLVYDNAGLLSQEDRAALETQAQAIGDEYGIDVAIVTIPSMDGTSDAYECAKHYYALYGIGQGDEQSGILLLLSMQNRDYALIAHGEANNVLTDYGNEQMASSFLNYFGEDDWMGGFSDYLATASDYCHAYFVEGEAVDISATHSIGRFFIFAAIIGAPLAGAFTVAALVQQMKTARKQTHAEFYVDREDGHDGLTLTDQSDDFIYTQTIVTHRPKPQNNGGFGGTTIDAGGFSGSSGKF